MIKDVFTFKKNSWHMQLMTFIWGYTHKDFPNMCPYFWLSLLNCFIALVAGPFYLVVKGITTIGRPILEFSQVAHESISKQVDEFCESKKMDWYREIKERVITLDDKIVMKFYKDEKFKKKLSSDYDAKDYYFNQALLYSHSGVIYAKDYLTPDEIKAVEAFLVRKEFLQEQENQRKREEREKEKIKLRLKWEKEALEEEKKRIALKASIERKKAIAAMTIKLQKVFKVIGIILASLGVIGTAWLLYHLALFVYSFPWAIITKYFFIFLGLVLLVCACVLIVYSIYKALNYLICKYGSFCIPCEERREKWTKSLIKVTKSIIIPFKKLYPFFEIIGNGITWLVNGIKTLWDILMMIKKNNCPAIDWK